MAKDLCPPLTGNWTHPDTKLVFSTTNRTVGTTVKVSCDRMYTDPEVKAEVDRILLCRHDGSWNDTLPLCPIMQTSVNHTGSRSISTEAIIIWSVGGALLLLLISLLIAIICAKRKDSRERQSRQPRQRPVSTIGLQNPGFVTILDQINQHCLVTEGGGCRSPQFVWPTAPPPYPGSLPRNSSTTATTTEANNARNLSEQLQSTAQDPERINSLPRPTPPPQEREVDVRAADARPDSNTSRQTPSQIPRPHAQTLQQPTRSSVRPRDHAQQSSASAGASRSATMQPHPNRERVQGRQSRVCSQPRRLAPTHMSVPAIDIMEPPPPYTPYPDYDTPRYPQRPAETSTRRGPERIQSIYI